MEISLGWLPAIIVVVGLLVVLTSCAIVVATVRQAALEQQDLMRRMQVECLVLRTRVNSAWVRTTTANAPAGGAPRPWDGEVRCRPQAMVRRTPQPHRIATSGMPLVPSCVDCTRARKRPASVSGRGQAKRCDQVTPSPSPALPAASACPGRLLPAATAALASWAANSAR